MSEQAALDAITATFPRFDVLRDRFSRAEAPASGSAFELDDATFPRQRLSELSRATLATAWDHFDLVRLTIDCQRTFVAATGSVTRGALVGSAQALWLLHPQDRATRRERGLTVAQEWYERRIQFPKGFEVDLSDADAARSREQVAMLIDDVEAVRAARTTNAKLIVTDVIEWSARARFGHEHLVREAKSEWRRLGGDAHAIGWQLMMQSVAWSDPSPDGLSTAKVTSRYSNIAEPYLAAWHMFEAALRRFDELMGTPG